MFLLLVVQVELTIVWNHFDGLKNLRSLGQLIPFILGVEGLLKVLWANDVLCDMEFTKIWTRILGQPRGRIS